MANIVVVEKQEIEDFIDKASKISPDSDDVFYFALAMKLNCPIWSHDEKFKNQNKIKIYNTKELMKKYYL